MTTSFHTIFAMVLMLATPAYAQYSPLKSLQGYEPSVISEAEAQDLYNSMPTNTFKERSECHQRAHNWVYNFFQSKGLKSMKAFLFFTDRYNLEFDYSWDYHVAPLVAVRKADGTIEEQILDPTFTLMPAGTSAADAKYYDNKPIPISEWIKYFIYPKVDCPVIESYQEFAQYQYKHYCYILKAPMYTYIPDNFRHETEVRTEWREGDLLEMLNGLKRQ